MPVDGAQERKGGRGPRLLLHFFNRTAHHRRHLHRDAGARQGKRAAGGHGRDPGIARRQGRRSGQHHAECSGQAGRGHLRLHHRHGDARVCRDRCGRTAQGSIEYGVECETETGRRYLGLCVQLCLFAGGRAGPRLSVADLDQSPQGLPQSASPWAMSSPKGCCTSRSSCCRLPSSACSSQ
jgi:hypothetical protein